VTAVDLTTAGGAVVRDLPHDDYLAHPALSASQAKILVQPGGPARYRWQLEHPEPPSERFDLGTAAHTEVLGVGAPVVPVDADSWRSKTAQEQRDSIRANGGTPVLRADANRVRAMATALRAHPLASRLLNPADGDPEVSLFYSDPEYGIDRRARVDFLRRADDTGRLILCDYKSCTSADPTAIDRAIGNYGYHLSAAWYRELIIGLGLASTVPVVLIFQETTAPFLVHVVELDDLWLTIGRDRTQQALRIFRQCTDTDTWPGYEHITVSTPPPWLLRQHDADMYGTAS
jgi:PDDEXK-like domain of unknown function (DUF3799)